MPSKAEALRRLTTQQATHEHREAFSEQVLGVANDRGACILLAADLENAIDAAIGQVLLMDYPRELYADDGPLATFARKSALAYALRIVGPVTRENLRIIRHIRNAFAHARIPIEFSTPEVAVMCDDLTLINPLPDMAQPRNQADKASLGPRLTFSDVCKCTAHYLYFYSLEPVLRFDFNALRPEMSNTTSIAD